jgi:hypothetical protein
VNRCATQKPESRRSLVATEESIQEMSGLDPSFEALHHPKASNLRLHTNPLRNSSSGYFVPRHTMPSFEKVWIMERSSVYMKRLVLTGCRKK